MARLQLILPLFLWALWRDGEHDAAAAWIAPGAGTLIYLLGLMVLLGYVHWTARRAMRRTTIYRRDPVPRFHRAVYLARWSALVWHGVALWTLGFGDALLAWVPTGHGTFEAAPSFASVLPIVATWIGLIVIQYPLDRGVREQNALYDLEFGQPVRPVPTRGQYVSHAVRSQVLFTLTPLLAIALARDLVMAGGLGLGWRAERVGWVATLASVVAVFVLAPELLRRVLPTEPLPASPLRDRLQGLSRRLRLGVRDILLWRTHFAMGNAAVMGLVPGVRYVLITDLLLDSMPPEEIEAVFAHEAGHVVHRHIAWYVVFWTVIVLVSTPLTDRAATFVAVHQWTDRSTAETAGATVGLLAAVALFGVLSRAFERQADAFAARRLTAGDESVPGRDGAAIFASALRTVARVNNLPLDHHAFTAGRPLVGRMIGRVAHHLATWLHGSIRSRIDHLARLAGRPAAARRFDRAMLGVRVALAIGLAAAAWAFWRTGGTL